MKIADRLFRFIFIAASLFVASCTRNAANILRKETGIVLCGKSIVTIMNGEDVDVTKFDIKADVRKCSPPLQLSIINASKNECRDLLYSKGSCSYSFKGRTVTVEQKVMMNNYAAFIVKSW